MLGSKSTYSRVHSTKKNILIKFQNVFFVHIAFYQGRNINKELQKTNHFE